MQPRPKINPLIKELKSLTRDQISEKIKSHYLKLLESLQSLKSKLSFNMDIRKRRKAIKHSLILLSDYGLVANALGLDVKPLQTAFKALKKFELSPETFTPTIADFIQTNVIDPFWNFHYHQVLNPKKSQSEMTETEKYAVLAEKVVAALTPEECSALLQPDAFIKDEDFSENYRIARNHLNNLNEEEQNKILPSTFLKTALERKIFPLKNLPEDIAYVIGSKVGLRNARSVSKTDTSANKLFKPVLNKEFLKSILIEVIRGGSPEKVDAALNAHPDLLTLKITGTDFSDRQYENVTLYQAALRADDVAMIKVIQKHFASLKNGDDIRAAQYKEEVDKWKNELTFDFKDVIDVITGALEADVLTALNKDTNSPLWEAMDEQFRKPFTECSLKEKHFNPEHLLKALSVYSEQFDKWSEDQRDLFWRQVIGYAERFLPAVHLQAFCEGLSYSKQFMGRTFNFIYDNSSICPRPIASRKGIGFDYAVGAHYHVTSLLEGQHEGIQLEFKSLCEKTAKEIDELKPATEFKAGPK